MRISLTEHQEEFIDEKMKGGGYLSQGEAVREALRVYELVEKDGSNQELEDALLHSLGSPMKKYVPGHFAALATHSGRRSSSL
jgi:putative addiction module CopG family antidote